MSTTDESQPVGELIEDEIEYAPPGLGNEKLPPKPPGAPDDLELRWEAPKPIPSDRADLGVRSGELRDKVGTFEHRFVTVGDSLTQGFKSFAIAEPWLSWPMIVAREMGLSANYRPADNVTGSEFTYASFSGPGKAPGLPLNLEALLRAVDAAVGGRSLDLEGSAMAAAVASVTTSVAEYWQHGDGAEVPSPQDQYHHNLAVWGFDLRDAMSKSPSWCKTAMLPEHRHTHFIPEIAKMVGRHIEGVFFTSHPMERTAIRVLAGPDPDATQLDAAKWFGDNGGIETLVVALGANNALSVVKSMKLRWTQDADY